MVLSLYVLRIRVKEHKDEPVSQKGIGLSNTEERLEKLYGKQQVTKISSS
jgi:sensor histidine kinase YesM